MVKKKKTSKKNTKSNSNFNKNLLIGVAVIILLFIFAYNFGEYDQISEDGLGSMKEEMDNEENYQYPQINSCAKKGESCGIIEDLSKENYKECCKGENPTCKDSELVYRSLICKTVQGKLRGTCEYCQNFKESCDDNSDCCSGYCLIDSSDKPQKGRGYCHIKDGEEKENF